MFSKELDRFPDAHLIDESGEFADMMRVFLPKPAPERGQIVSSKDVWSVKDTCGALAKHMLFDAKVEDALRWLAAGRRPGRLLGDN